MHAPIISTLGADLDTQAMAAKTEQRRRELCLELAEIRQERAGKPRRRIYRESCLTPYRRDLLILRAGGASYPEMALWLRRNKEITVSHTTVMRYMAGLSQRHKEIAENQR